MAIAEFETETLENGTDVDAASVEQQEADVELTALKQHFKDKLLFTSMNIDPNTPDEELLTILRTLSTIEDNMMSPDHKE